MNHFYKSPAWKTRAVRHSGIRTKRQISQRPTTSNRPIPFVNHDRPRTGAPKNHGRRLHLEQLP